MKNNRRIGSIVLMILVSIFVVAPLTAPRFVGAVSYIDTPLNGTLTWSFFDEATYEEWNAIIEPEASITIPTAFASGSISAQGNAPEPEEGWNGGFPSYYGKLYKINNLGEREYFNDSYGSFTIESGSYEFDVYYVTVRLSYHKTFFEKLAEFIIPRAYAQRFPGQYDEQYYLGTIRFSVVVGNAPTCCSSVAFFPGLQASRLYSGGGAKRWEPVGSGDVRSLFMNSSGESVDSTIYTKDAVDTFKVLGINTVDIYDGFFGTLDALVSEGSIASWKAFPYDWRKSVLDIVTHGVTLETEVIDLANELETLAQQSLTKKVILVAHSNGGLVVKALMRKLEAEGKAGIVEKVVFVAVPQLGTPDAVKALLHGMSVGFGLVLDAQSARGLAENMPGVYGLVPSESYFDAVTDPIITFDSSVGEVSNFIQTYGTTITSKASLDAFLSGSDGRQKPGVFDLDAPNVANASLLSQATALHDNLDAWTAPQGVEVVQIAGWGINTIKGINYIGKFPCSRLITFGDCAPYVDPEPVMTREGDKTVVYPSAIALGAESLFFNIRSFNQIERKNLDHKNILEAFPVKSFIESLILDTSYTDEYISEVKPEPDNTEEMLHIAMHSPASIDMYDSDGRHTGIIPGTGDIQRYEESIPNSYYFELGESKYTGAPNDAGTEIKIRGTGAGTFTFVVEEREGDVVKNTTTFTDIPVTPELQATYVPSITTPTLAVDSDGNGSVDFSVSSGDTVDPVVFLQMFKKTIISLKLPAIIERQLLQKIDKLIAVIKKDSKKKEKLISAIQHYKRELEERKWKKTKKLSIEQKAILIVMMNGLLDNIK